jgi:hypothetical protein
VGQRGHEHHPHKFKGVKERRAARTKYYHPKKEGRDEQEKRERNNCPDDKRSRQNQPALHFVSLCKPVVSRSYIRRASMSEPDWNTMNADQKLEALYLLVHALIIEVGDLGGKFSKF